MSEPLPPINPAIGLMFTAADLMIPIFIKAAMGDAALARQMALIAIEDYQPTTRADYVNLARTIAFSMASIALLGQAASPDMALPEKMRALGRANALNRSADQSERTMMQRHRFQHAKPGAKPADLGAAAHAAQAAAPQISDADLEASIAEAMKEYLASCTQPKGRDAAPETTPVVSRIELPGATPIAAVHNRRPEPSNKTHLLQSSAMQRGAAPLQQLP
jgi:hypothetical protein